MKHIAGIAAVVVLLPLLIWGGYGFYVYSRNRLPPIALAGAGPEAPADNVYDELVKCVLAVQETQELMRLSKQPDYGSTSEKKRVIEANRELIGKVRQLVHKPSQVTRLEYHTGDPTVENYRHLARLMVTYAKWLEQQGNTAGALDAYLDGFAFFEKVQNGGNSLHLTFNFTSTIVLFEAIPSLLPRLSAGDAQRGAQRLERLLQDEYPLRRLLEQDFRVRFQGWQRTVQGMSMRGFRLDMPQSPLEQHLLYLPKAGVTQAAMQYAEQWLEQAERPYPQQQVISYPLGMRPLNFGGEEHDIIARLPSDIDLQIGRYTYVRTRFRLLYTALKLQAYRKTHGRYPARLNDLGTSPYFIDPFANKPFVYRSQGNSYVLYSLGPNSQDDGGAPFPESNLRRGQPGDIGLVPNFLRAPQ